MATLIRQARFATEAPRWPAPGLDDRPLVAFAGRSNVGKSSLLNSLTNRRGLARTSRTPGRTQAIVVFDVVLKREGVARPCYFLDLPGFGFAQAPESVRRAWTPMMRAVLHNNPRLRAVLLLMDARHAPTGTDSEAIELLQSWQAPWMPVATKVDKLGKTKLQQRLAQMARDLGVEREDLRAYSSETGQGREALLEELHDLVALTGERV